MDTGELACGDKNNILSISPRQMKVDEKKDEALENSSIDINNSAKANTKTINHNVVTPKLIEDNEVKLKERIAQCRSIIESLKCELNKEKFKLEKESIPFESETSKTSSRVPAFDDELNSDRYTKDLLLERNLYTSCMESRLNYDENMAEYEKQLQRYQNTLNMAQLEKKNAIRKQMLAKAFNLKILEVENQCNIELLRVKQSLQCLEPLRMIANKWKTNVDDSSDLNTFELIPRYPELKSNDVVDANRTVCVDMEKKLTLENFKNNLEDVDILNSLDS
ncbi:unnamed protein product [Parnassius apollo]|uniref:(apollo) hypothetical protein n=1 Tax=Parnassius apollo TaxID=110799 RepID=A0A8S3X332_PARAO|nr:unnamed protein product [Parnassius apollo]